MRRLLAIALLLVAARAAAQSRSFDVDHLQLAVTSGDFPGTEGAAIDPWTFRAAAAWRYSDGALLVDVGGGAERLIGARSLVEVSGAFAVGRYATFGADLPVLVAQTGIADGGAALGDLRLVGRVDPFRAGAWHLAALFAVRLPTGDTTRFLGEGYPVAEPRAVAEWSGGRVRVALNLGARFRRERQFADLTVGNELFASAALAVRPHHAIDLFTELHADTALSGNFLARSSTPVELLLGASTRWRDFSATAAAGPGLVDGFGSPRFRALVSIAYTPSTRRPRPSPAHAPAPAPEPVPVDNEPEPEPEPVPVPVDEPVPVEKPAPSMVAVGEPVLFSLNRARIRSAFVPSLAAIAESILATSSEIVIAGHADDTGNPAWNLALSQRRADNVLRFLVGRGVPAERLRAIGYGETRPAVPNSDDASREKNRRVVLLVEKTEAP